jgi:hypothetical protein
MLIPYIYIVKKKDPIQNQIDAILTYQVKKEDLFIFNRIVNEEVDFDKFILESSEATYRIDKTNKTITVLRRNYRLGVDESSIFSYNDVVDFEVVRVCKIAKEAGFDYFLENQYMN